MALRKFMHPRNKYRNEPDFKQFSILYPEFRKIAIMDLAGKVRINFKDEESLRVLAKTLLKHDFDIEVDIPLQKLVPAMPLRLNYILWIEDLLKHSGVEDFTTVHGIDIGTGAVCIYPLLCHKMFRCKMKCSDIDTASVKSANENILRNNFEDFIKVILVKKDNILEEILNDDETYTFVMCNPPFFTNDENFGRKSKKQPPRNAPTGNDGELNVEGGEKEFVQRLIEESVEHKDKVKIFTTMLGQKSSLSVLRTELTNRDIVNTTWTEFCQGFTKRWGIAWTFLPKEVVDLSTAPVIRTRSEVIKKKHHQPMDIVFPPRDDLDCAEAVADILKKLMTELRMKTKEIEMDEVDQSCWACELTALEDTWTHARRKRRMAMRENDTSKKFKNCDETESIINKSEEKESKEPWLVAMLLVEEIEDIDEEEEEDIEEALRICLIFKSGLGGKLALESLRQYLINRLNLREYFHKQPNKTKKKKKKHKKPQNCAQDVDEAS